MANLNTYRERQRAFFWGTVTGNFPIPEGELDVEQRAAVWASFYAGAEIHSPYYKPDLTGETLALMIEQFKRSTDFKKLVSAFTDELQETEDTLDDLIMRRMLEYAEGEQLDGIGDIVGEPRNGRADAEYRTAITFKVFINVSSGQPEVMLTVLKTITEATQVRLIEMFPATIYMFTDGTVIPADLISTMYLVAPSAVALNIVSSFGETPFEFSGEGGIPYDEGDGFSEYNYTEGGQPIGGNFSELVL